MHAQVSNYTRLEPIDCLKPTRIYTPQHIQTSSWSPATPTARITFLPGIQTSISIIHNGSVPARSTAGTMIGIFQYPHATSPNWRRIRRPGPTWAIPYSTVSQPEISTCQLLPELSLTITMIVTNFLILLVMLVCLTCYWHELEQTLSCFGNFVASHLESEEATKRMYLADKQ